MFSPTVTLAFAAGMVATFNPCGFSLLPAYVTAFVATDTVDDRVERRILRAAGAAAVMSFAFVLVFTVVGWVVGTLAEQAVRQLPWITVAVGTLLTVAGVAMVIGWKPTLSLPKLNLKRPKGRMAAMTIYGATFAVASLSCTIGPFLAVTGAVINRSTGETVAAYLAYALGMGFMVLVISLAVAIAHNSLVTRMRRLAPRVSRLGGALMILAGLYVIWYARWELAVFAGNPETDSVIDTGESIRAWFISLVDTIGAGRITAVTLIAIVLGITVARAQRKRRDGISDAPEDNPTAEFEAIR